MPLLSGTPNLINRNRMVLGRRKKSQTSSQTLESQVSNATQAPVVWLGFTDSNTPEEIFINGIEDNRYFIADDQCVVIDGTVIAKEVSSSYNRAWNFRGVYKFTHNSFIFAMPRNIPRLFL